MVSRTTGVFLAAALLTGCTDRLQPSDDPWSRTGELVAQSGGEGGARYACVTCHGTRGEGNGFDAPRLSGLPVGYLQKQMEDYARKLLPHAVMQDVAGFLDSEDRVKVAGYYAAMPPTALPTATLEPAPAGAGNLYRDGDPSRGLASCASCHGEEGSGAAGGPPLQGQPAFYLAKQLRDWQQGKRRNDGQQVMLRTAQAMSEAEVQAVSVYLAAIPPGPPRQDR